MDHSPVLFVLECSNILLDRSLL